MRSPFPPWLQSTRGMIAAALLLAVLLATVPGLVSTTRTGATQGWPGDGEHSESAAPSEIPSDPLSPSLDDWLAGNDPDDAASSFGRADTGMPLDCLIQPSRVIELGSQATGLIEAIHVERGDRVEPGQVVVELEADAERAAVALARERAGQVGLLRAREEAYALSKKRKERGVELFEKSALATDSRDELETQANLARYELFQAQEARQIASLELRQAQALLSRRTLRIPIGGIVVEQLLEVGEIVDDQTILTVARVDPLRVDVLMPASRFGSLRQNMRASVEPEYPVRGSVIATISVIDPVIDAASGTFNVRLDLPNPDGAIPGGLHCTVQFLDD